MTAVTEDPLARQISGLERDEVIDRLMHFQGRVALDFTTEFLAKQSTEHLKHILLAAHKHLG